MEKKHDLEEKGKKTSKMDHPYMKNLEKFINKKVIVKDIFDRQIEGKCLAIYKPHLNVIVETVDEIIIVKNPQTIKRKRNRR